MGKVLTSICVSSRICLQKEILSKSLIIGYDCPNVEDCKCQQFIKASQPLHFIKVSRTLLHSNVLCRLHNSDIYDYLLSIPLPCSFSTYSVWIKRSLLQCNRATHWMEEISSGPVALQVQNHFQQPNLPLDISQWKHEHSVVESGSKKERVTRAAETAKGI